MFIGHFGAAFAAKKVDTRPSLGTYLMASLFIDLLWPVFLILGIEKVAVDPGNTAFTPLDFIYYPFSHSLVWTIIWGFLFGMVYFLLKRKLRTAVIMGIIVLSHWILDFITHRPDLPLMPGIDIFMGLGIWNSVPLTIIIEGVIFIVGIIYYTSITRPLNKKGSIGWWSLIIFLVIMYIMNITGTPPDENAIGYAGLAQWIIVLWGYFADRNRVTE